MTAGKRVRMYADGVHLVVLTCRFPEEAEIVYDGRGAPAGANAGKTQKNGQGFISLAKLRAIDGQPENEN
jgi:hypothetical protein